MKSRIRPIALLLALLPLGAWAQPGSGRPPMDPAAMAARQTQMMSDSLGLSEEQKSQVEEINLRYANKMGEIRQTYAGDMENMRLEMMVLRDEKDAELKKVLSKDQQKKWRAIQMRMRGPGGFGPGGPPPGGPPPGGPPER
jgi:Spy/CpxP family protein refolding chaperone